MATSANQLKLLTFSRRIFNVIATWIVGNVYTKTQTDAAISASVTIADPSTATAMWQDESESESE